MLDMKIIKQSVWLYQHWLNFICQKDFHIILKLNQSWETFLIASILMYNKDAKNILLLKTFINRFQIKEKIFLKELQAVKNK